MVERSNRVHEVTCIVYYVREGKLEFKLTTAWALAGRTTMGNNGADLSPLLLHIDD